MTGKLYGTLGPACADTDTLRALLRAGMRGVRLNLSHGPLAERAPWLESLRRAETAEGVSCELLIDLQGPELRVGALFAPLTLREEKFVALMHQCAGCAEIVPLPCPELVEFVERGGLDSPALTAYLARQLGPYAGRVDAAVLGCTHFPFARRAIRAALGGNVTLYDGSDGTARETLRQPVRRGWVRGGSHGVVTLENSLPSELPLSRRLLALPRED